MESVNSNRVTASKLVRRALQIADIENTDFLSYEELTEYLNSTFKNVYQTIINYNLNIFTVDANLVGASGRYKIPFDCYQIKSVKNPYTGRMIPRKADSESSLGGYYEIVNDELVLGPSVGPVVVTYWRKPFWLSIPNKPVKSELESKTIISTCNNSALVVDGDNKLYIQNYLTDNELELPYTLESNTNYKLGNNFILKWTTSGTTPSITSNWYAYDFYGNLLGSTTMTTEKLPWTIISDNGIIYWGNEGSGDYDGKYLVFELFGEDPIAILDLPEQDTKNNIIGIDGEFYFTDEEDVFPIGIFDDRPSYITNDKKLHLINPDGSQIIEKVDVPSIGPTFLLKYGFLTFDGTVYSCIPDTLLDFPNNLYYDVISYDLAIRFLCKQNADSSGVENLNRNAWTQLTSSIDQSADYPRIKLVRR